MKLEGDKFYLVEVGEDKWIYSDRDEGVKTLKEEIAKKPELDTKEVGIFEIDTVEKKWNIRQVPWAEIAMGLIRGEKSES